MLTLKNIHKTYQTSKNTACHALNGISCSFAPGVSYAVIGPSGSGKSTLLKVIAGLISSDTGECLFQGKDITHLPDRSISALRNRQIGMVVQDFALLENETVLRNCMLPALLVGTSRKKAKEEAMSLLERFGIVKYIDKNTSLLSGGERQRVAIARALINKPVLLLADEPTGALDTENARLVMGELLSVCQSNTTLIVATHDIGFANMCSERIRICDGMIVES